MKSKIILYVLFSSVLNFSFAQNTSTKPMEKLNFMIGHWVGTSNTYENHEIIKSIPAYEEVQFLLDGEILTLDLHSESLTLHTVIYYDDENEYYSYNPYSKSGARSCKGEFINGKLLVWLSDERRVWFESLKPGQFQETGEKLIDGNWQLYFQDVFTDAP